METKLVTSNLGVVNPESIDDYIARGGYRALEKAASDMSSPQMIDALETAGLIGRGGAAFPTALKRELAVKAQVTQPWPAPAYVPAPYRRSSAFVICNADESETGTFKDRLLMEGDPFRILEGMAITAFITCATNGFIYLRGEYPLAYERLSRAIDTARQRGYLGERILRDDFDFDVEIRRGAGAYICGEETALFESIEGKRGEPRTKPPFPTDAGLFQRPTVINNVETFANIPFIALEGAEAYRKFGTAKSPGTRVVCVSGQVIKPGAYEIAMGTPLREVIYDLAGGLRDGRTLQAILIGGAAGVFLRPDEIDVPLDEHESLPAPGGRVKIAIRPERVKVFYKDELPAGALRFKAVLLDSVFLGDACQIYLDFLKKSPDKPLTALAGGDRYSAHDDLGVPVIAAVQPEDVYILESDGR